MSHSKNLINVPDVNSQEFKEFLEKNGFDQIKNLNNDCMCSIKFSDVHDDNNENDDISEKSDDLKKDVAKGALIFCGIMLLGYAFTVSTIARGVFKGNLKTQRYFMKHGSYLVK